MTPQVWVDAQTVGEACLKEISSVQHVAEAQITDEVYPLTHDAGQLLYHLLLDVYQPKKIKLIIQILSLWQNPGHFTIMNVKH